MHSRPFGFGIVGTGRIAGVIANALARSTNAQLCAVSSRQLENGEKFVAQRPGVDAVQGLDRLLKTKAYLARSASL